FGVVVAAPDPTPEDGAMLVRLMASPHCRIIADLCDSPARTGMAGFLGFRPERYAYLYDDVFQRAIRDNNRLLEPLLATVDKEIENRLPKVLGRVKRRIAEAGVKTGPRPALLMRAG
ncbi:MAG: hypothetical protein M3O22_07915, partial [Pseudomonadota bacterium]|nr:hypothetical protein [Pseudomonadota bacterium]